MQNHKNAVVIIIKDNLVLSVPRKSDTSTFGLIGGKIDPGETAKEAAIRECFEETGLQILDLDFIYSDGTTACFFVKSIAGTINTNELPPVFLTKQILISDKSPFSIYNANAFASLDSQNCITKFI